MAGLLTDWLGQESRTRGGPEPHLPIEFPAWLSALALGFGNPVDSLELWGSCFLWSSINSSIKRGLSDLICSVPSNLKSMSSFEETALLLCALL